MGGIKDNWLKTDEVCSHCGNVTKEAKGITKQNLKKLLIPKFNLNELVITLVLILMLTMAYSYSHETKICREWIGPMFSKDAETCKMVCSEKCSALKFNPVNNTTTTTLNLSNWNLLIPNESTNSS